jgi:hypothetical protein
MTISQPISRSKAEGEKSLINISNKFFGDGVRIMEEPFAEGSEFIQCSRVIGEGLMNKAVFGEFKPQPSRDLSFGRCIFSIFTAQIEIDRIGRNSNICTIQEVKDISICRRHPWNYWGHWSENVQTRLKFEETHYTHYQAINGLDRDTFIYNAHENGPKKV